MGSIISWNSLPDHYKPINEGECVGVRPLPDKKKSIEEVYHQILGNGNDYLKVAALLDIPPLVKDRFPDFIKETENMIPLLEKCHWLKKDPVLKRLSLMDLMVVAEVTREEAYDAGHVLFKAGDVADALYLIIEGRINVLDSEGNKIISPKAPVPIGERAMVYGSIRRVTVKCAEACRALIISSDDVDDILEKIPHLYKYLVIWLLNYDAEDNYLLG